MSTFLHENEKTESGKKLKAEALPKMSICVAASTTQVDSNSNVNNPIFKKILLGGNFRDQNSYKSSGFI